MNSADEKPTQEILLHCYRKLRQKEKLCEKIPSICIIFGEFLAKAGHRRFFLHECESFINIKRNAGRFIITFSVFDESIGKIDEFIATWKLLKDGRENYTIQRTSDSVDKSSEARDRNDKYERKIWIHYEDILRKFIEFLKKRDFVNLKSELH